MTDQNIMVTTAIVSPASDGDVPESTPSGDASDGRVVAPVATPIQSGPATAEGQSCYGSGHGSRCSEEDEKMSDINHVTGVADITGVAQYAQNVGDDWSPGETTQSGADHSPVPEDAQLLDDITRAIQQLVILPPAEAQMAALWVMHAHTHPAHQHSPRLAVKSPKGGCGKTTLCRIIAQLLGVKIFSNATPSSIFRTMDRDQGRTVILDELVLQR
jgi:hypothetical protein